MAHSQPESQERRIGKTFVPTNYTVVQGLFVQSDPGYKDDGYDVLGDSFGLIDKSLERWIKFER